MEQISKTEQIHESILNIKSNPNKIPFTNPKEPTENEIEKPEEKIFPTAAAHNAHNNSLNAQHISYPRYEQLYIPLNQDQKGNNSMRQENIPKCSDDENSITHPTEQEDATSDNYSIAHDGNSRTGDYFARSKFQKACNKGKMDNVKSVAFIRKHVTVVMENETEILEKYTSLRNQLARG